jgi:serine/threonine-protein kinase Chk2
MAPNGDKTQLKRGRVCPHRCVDASSCTDTLPQGTAGEDVQDSKKPRRSARLSSNPNTPVSKGQQLPSPLTAEVSTPSSEALKEGTATPPEGRPSQIRHRTPEETVPAQVAGLSSPPQDTQAFSQFVFPTSDLSDDVANETEEGVWGYLLPLDPKYGKSLVLKKRSACPMPDGMEDFGKDSGDKHRMNGDGKDFKQEEIAYEQTKKKGIASGGYLIGRHPECGMLNSKISFWTCHFDPLQI